MNERNYDELEGCFLKETAGFQGKVAYLFTDMNNNAIHFEKIRRTR